jgi:endo-1,4-beta-xylanase
MIKMKSPRLKHLLLAVFLTLFLTAGTGFSQAPGKEAVVIDGFEITASVSGTPLKDAYRDYFLIGVGLNGNNIATDTLNSRAMTEIIKYHFNSVTYSNLMKPSYLLDREGSIANLKAGNPEPAVKFDTVIKGLEFCKANGIKMRGHVLVWHTQTPAWFFREGYSDFGKYVDRETMLLRLESYIRQVLEFTQKEYPGVIYAWDVVNEAVEDTAGHYETESGFNIRTKFNRVYDNPWYVVVGIDYVEKAFAFARKYAAPGVKLFYNDYNTFQPVKTRAIYKLAAHLKEKGLIDGIGMQGYMSLTYPGISSGVNNFLTALAILGELGLEIHVTELSINPQRSDAELFQIQADRYEEVFRVLLDVKTSGLANVTSVTVFGLMDNYLFYPNDRTLTRLFDRKLQPKPAFYSVLKAVEEFERGRNN